MRMGLRAHILHAVASDKNMQLLVFAVVILGVPAGALLHAALAPDGNLGVGLLLHALLRVTARPDDQPDEIVTRVVLLRDEDLRSRDTHLLLPMVDHSSAA